jgi:hypothetical protein
MSTYTPIATQTLASAATSVTFSSIPQGYTDLVLVVSALNNTALNTSFQFQVGNNTIDTGSNYSLTELFASTSSVSSDKATSDTAAYLNGPGIGASTTTPNIYVTNLMNYSNSTTYKTFLGTGGSVNQNLVLTTNLWRSTSAINTIKIFQSVNSMAAGSTFTLYGIQAGNRLAKAYGGTTVTTDGSYWYHTFKSSGAFIPKQALTASVLVIAGGGGGQNGGAGGGGGGAGGISYQADRSISLGSYSVVVGGGGNGGTTNVGSAGSNSIFDTITSNGGGGGALGTLGAGGDGGSGGGAQGAGAAARSGGSATQGNTGGATGYGFAGGATAGTTAGGGGGAGEVGNSDGNGFGGDGLSTWSSWGSATSTGQNISGTYWYGGGGAGWRNSTAGGGGGDGGGADFVTSTTAVGIAGMANTGGGGGSGGGSGAGYAGGAGGSGLVIIRYAV